jgi:MFS transporter, ACS family, tartrate transporter
MDRADGLLTGTAAAGGIAHINAIGNIGGFVGPYLVGWMQCVAMKLVADQADANALSLAAIGGFMIAAGATPAKRRLSTRVFSPGQAMSPGRR